MEPKFESNQAAFMPKKNAAQETELQKLNDELAKAEEDISRNVSARMVFFDLALKVIVLLIQ